MAVVLIVVGPKRLPAAARKIGKIMSELRRAAQSFKDEIMRLDEPVQPERRNDFPSEVSPDDPSIPDLDDTGGEAGSLYEHYSRNGYYDGEEPDAESSDTADGPDGSEPAADGATASGAVAEPVAEQPAETPAAQNAIADATGGKESTEAGK